MGALLLDVTDAVEFSNNDDECLPLTKCICGAKWSPWSGPILSIYDDSPTECPQCRRRFIFHLGIRVKQVLG